MGSFRPDTNYEAARFRLQNLDPTATYLVTDLDQPATPQELSARKLLERGLLVTLPDRPSARIVTYQISGRGR